MVILVVERRAETLKRKTLTRYETEQRVADLDRFSINDVSNRNYWKRGKFWEVECAYKIFVRKLKGERPL